MLFGRNRNKQSSRATNRRSVSNVGTAAANIFGTRGFGRGGSFSGTSNVRPRRRGFGRRIKGFFRNISGL